MTIDDHIKDEKLQYDVSREAAKISVLSSGKTNKYKCLTGEEVLPSNQKQIIGQSKFTYFPLGKDNRSNKINWRSNKISSRNFSKRSWKWLN